MRRQNRKILLLVDNCFAHIEVGGITKVTVKFLPVNTTNVLQPGDRGIIRTLKAHFQNQLRKIIIKFIDNTEEEVLANDIAKTVYDLDDTQTNMLHDAWNCVSSETIGNC